MSNTEIVSTEDTLGGKYRIKGTRVRVIDVIESYQELGWDIEEISEEYGLKPQQVLEALKFFYDNKETIRKEFMKGAEENSYVILTRDDDFKEIASSNDNIGILYLTKRLRKKKTASEVIKVLNSMNMNQLKGQVIHIPWN